MGREEVIPPANRRLPPKAESFQRSYRSESLPLPANNEQPPYPMPPVVPPEKWRTVDLANDQPNWSGELLLFLQEYDETAEAAEQHVAAGQAARGLVPDDVGKVLAGIFQISRNRKGILAITRRAAA